MADPTSGADDLPPVLRAPARLAALARTGLLDSGADPSFDRLSRLAGLILEVPIALVSLVDDHRQYFQSCPGLPEPWASRRETPLSHSFCRHVVATGEPLVVEDSRRHPLVRDNPAIEELGIVAYLGVPLAVDRQVIGSFCVVDVRPRAWTEREVAIIRDLAESVVSEIRLRDEHRTAVAAQAKLQTTLASIGDGVISTDASGAVSFLNPMAEALTGWTDAEAIGRPMAEVFRIVHEATREPVPDPVAAVLERGTIVSLADRTILIARDGTERSIDDSAAPIRLPDRTFVGCILVFRDVTDKARIARELSDARTRLDAALSAGAIATWTWDLIANRIVADRNLERLFSVTPEEANGGSPETYLRAVHPADLGRVAEAIERAIASGNIYDVEYRVVQPDGSARHVVARGTVERDASGRAVSLPGVVIDITDLRRAEEVVREQETFQRLVFESVADFSIFTTDLAGTILSWNAGAENVFGYTEAEAVGRPAGLVFTSEDRGAGVPEQELRSAIETGIGTDERWLVRKDGSRFFASGVVRPIADTAGRLVGFTKVARDITAAKLAADALRQSESKYRTLFDSMDQGYCVIEVLRNPAGKAVDYRFLEVNPAFEQQTGLHDAAGKRMREFVPDHDEFWFETYGRIAATGEPLRFQYTGESMQGQSFDLFAFQIGDPTEQKVAVLFTNITHRKRAEEQRQQLVDQLTEADRRKDEFLAMLAHELRNPLGAISSGIRLVRKTREPGTLEQVQDLIDRQTRHLTHLIDDLLDVSRIATGKIVLRRQTIELGHAIARAVDQVRPIVGEKRHTLTIDRPKEAVLFVADPTRCEQILGNLLTNAAKYTPAGGTIHLDARLDGVEIVFTITDNGVGIPAALLPQVFGLFTQIDSSIDRSQGGLGIGLTLVRSLVEMHGGRVSAASDGPDRGSTFTVRLPIGAPAAVAVGSAVPEAIRPTNAQRRILIVDDNRDTAKMTARLLTHAGNKTLTAHDGHEGIEAARAFRPDVVLLDIGLPGMNGYEVARALRDDPAFHATVIVAVSGYGEDAARERSRESGFDHHLTKPLDFDHLDEILRATVPVAR